MKLTYRPFMAAAFLLFLLACANESRAQMAAIAAIDEPEAAIGGSASEGGGGGQGSSKTGKSAAGNKKPSRTTNASATKPKPKPKPSANFNGMVLGDKYTFLNNEVVSAEKPYHTRAAKASGAKGLVQVEVLVAEDGSVFSAKARTGNKELWPESERAAYASKFNRPTSNGRPARAVGFLVYRFGPAEIEE